MSFSKIQLNPQELMNTKARNSSNKNPCIFVFEPTYAYAYILNNERLRIINLNKNNKKKSLIILKIS